MQPCERYLNVINERVDGTLGPLRRAELDLHLETCDGCRALVEDLEAIAGAAASLPVLEPPPQVWMQVTARLRAEGRGSSPAASGRRHSHALLALAATLALAVGGSLFALFPRERAAAPGGAATQPAEGHGAAGTADPAVQGPAAEFDLAAEHVRKALEGLDPETAALVAKEVQVMDEALANARRAVAAEPSSAAANRSLYDTLKQKVKFLQDTIALMNKIRQGDAAGAAEIVEGKS